MSAGSCDEGRRSARIGAVLAGGASTRMGAPKPSVELAGRPLIAYPLEAVAAGGLEPVVVAKRESELPRVECPVVADAESSRHPAAGILAALGAADGRAAVVLACDMPFAPPSLIEVLAGLDRPAAVPRIGGRLQPLLARYGPAAIPVLQAAVAEGRPLNEAVAALDPLVLEAEELARFGEPETIAFNVNDPDDLATAARLMAVGATR